MNGQDQKILKDGRLNVRIRERQMYGCTDVRMIYTEIQAVSIILQVRYLALKCSAIGVWRAATLNLVTVETREAASKVLDDYLKISGSRY